MNSNSNLNIIEFLKQNKASDSSGTELLRSHLDLIEVRPPYFALRSLMVHNGRILASFPVQALIANECGPVTTAEIGRHMAILGSLAMAMANPVKEQHYYLALHAHVNRIDLIESKEESLVGIINTCHSSKKGGSITGEVVNSDGKIIYEVSVDYSTLHHCLFTRLFKHGYQEPQEQYNVNPYLQAVELHDIKLGFETCSASLGMVNPVDCLGHFTNYPALPVARLGGALTQMAGIHFNFLSSDIPDKYVISNAEIKAHFLPFAGEEVFLKSYVTSNLGKKGIEFKSLAIDNSSKIIAELTTLISKPKNCL